MSIETAEPKVAKIYVWTKTERAGQTVIEDSVEGEFTVFTDGTRCRTSLLNEMVIEAKSKAQAYELAQPFLSPGTTIDKTETPDVVVETKSTEPTGDVNVMLEMLKKISAKNTISMPLELNVPSKEVYELFKDQMDITKADLNDHILELVLSQIDNLQAQLKPQAEEFIKTNYKGKKATRRQSNSGAEGASRAGSKDAPDITY